MTWLLRLLPPHKTNLKKRLVKDPKLYIRDTGQGRGRVQSLLNACTVALDHI